MIIGKAMLSTRAEGGADLYPRLGPTYEWGIATGDTILHTAGGHIINITRKPIFYGKITDKFLNCEFIACSKYLVDSVVAVLRVSNIKFYYSILY